MFRSLGGWTTVDIFPPEYSVSLEWPELPLGWTLNLGLRISRPSAAPYPSFRGEGLGLCLAEALLLLSPTGTDMAVFCLLCGKRFQAQSALQQHMEVHAGVRSYICSECNRTFPSHTALKRHLRSHTGRLVPGGGGGGAVDISGPCIWA